MTQVRAMSLTIDIDPGSDPIAGSIAGPTGSARRFSGLLDLLSNLERLRAAQAQAPRGTAPDSSGGPPDANGSGFGEARPR
jgi:hypothetical protein